MKNWLIGGVAILLLGAILILSDLKVETPSGLDFIRNPNQYAEANNKAALLAYEIFQRADGGGAITDDDKVKIREALKYFKAMNMYDPMRVKSFVGAGRCYQYLGEKQSAAECYEQAVLNRTRDKDPNKEEVDQTAYEAAASLAEVSLDLAAEEIANYNSLSQANDKAGAEQAKNRSLIYYKKALDNATAAVEGVPKAARYLAIRANVYLALKKDELAKEDIAKAKVIDANDPRVKMTAKMLGL